MRLYHAFCPCLLPCVRVATLSCVPFASSDRRNSPASSAALRSNRLEALETANGRPSVETSPPSEAGSQDDSGSSASRLRRFRSSLTPRWTMPRAVAGCEFPPRNDDMFKVSELRFSSSSSTYSSSTSASPFSAFCSRRNAFCAGKCMLVAIPFSSRLPESDARFAD